MKHCILLFFVISICSCKEEKTTSNDIKNNHSISQQDKELPRKEIDLEGNIFHLKMDAINDYKEISSFYGKYSIDRFNKENSCISLDGISDLFEINNIPQVNPQNELTISIWYKPDSYKGNGQNSIVWKGFTEYKKPFGQYYFTSVGNLYPKTPGTFRFGLSLNGKLSYLSTPASFWEPNNWYNLVGTYNGNQMKFYVNGELVKTKNVSGQLDIFDTYLLIGKTPHEEFYTSGLFDDFRIFERALSQNEISILYSEK